MRRAPVSQGEQIIRPGIVIPSIGPTAGDAELCAQYGIPQVSLDGTLSRTAAASEAIVLAVSCMPDQQFMVPNAGGILKRAIGLEPNDWGSGSQYLSSQEIFAFHKANPRARVSYGISIALRELTRNPSKVFYTPRVATTLQALQEQGALDSPLAIPASEPTRRGGPKESAVRREEVLRKPRTKRSKTSRKLSQNGDQLRPLHMGALVANDVLTLTVEPPVDADEQTRLEQAGIVSSGRWFKLATNEDTAKPPKPKTTSAYTFNPDELTGNPVELVRHAQVLIATVLRSTRGEVSIDGQPYEHPPAQTWSFAVNTL